MNKDRNYGIGNKIKAVWQLMRLEHGGMIVLAIFVGFLIAERAFPVLDKLLLTVFTAIFLQASTFALNDYYDLEIDRINNRIDRPLVRGDLKPRTALYLFFICYPLGIICSSFVNPTCFLIAVITGIFAIFYDVFLKKVKVLGNFFIAYTMAIPFVFGGAAVLKTNTFDLNLHPAILIISLIAFLTGVGREIMKDVMDFEGDREKGVKSFPYYFGIYISNVITALFYISAVILSFLPFLLTDYGVYYQNIYYLVIVLVTDAILFIAAIQLVTSLQQTDYRKTNMRRERRYTLVAMFFGLLAFLVGALVGG